jgi:hypothetical protein
MQLIVNAISFISLDPSLLVLCCASGAQTTELSGHVQLLEGSEHGKSVIVVYAEALGPHEAPKPGHYELKQHDKTFVPHVLAVPVGSTVTFPNNDPIFTMSFRSPGLRL